MSNDDHDNEGYVGSLGLKRRGSVASFEYQRTPARTAEQLLRSFCSDVVTRQGVQLKRRLVQPEELTIG